MDQKPKEISELRQDPVSRDWIIISTARAKRPEAYKNKNREAIMTPIDLCPFEDPQKHGNGEPLLVYTPKDSRDWFVQVIKNKFPIVEGDKCGLENKVGPYTVQNPAAGRNEVVITKDHNRGLAQMNTDEVMLVIKAYKERYGSLKKEEYARYILIIHNHGREAGASVSHPHSQILALPFVPSDIKRSLDGSQKYHQDSGRCAHCDILDWELKEKSRIIFENDLMVALTPFAPKFSYEIRIFPKKHSSYFEEIESAEIHDLAEALRVSLAKIYQGLGNPAYNFFIHTPPASHNKEYDYYHWHLEINPRLGVWGGFELGTGGDVIDTDPDEAARYLRSIKV